MQIKILKTALFTACLWQGLSVYEIAYAGGHGSKEPNESRPENVCPSHQLAWKDSCWENMGRVKVIGNEPCPRGQEPYKGFCWRITGSINTPEGTSPEK